MTTYGEVRTKFKSRLRRRDCTDALADGFLSDSVKRIQRTLKVPAGEKSVQATLDDDFYFDNDIFAIPADFLQLKDIVYNGKTILQRKSLQEVLTAVECGVEGTTRIFARQGAGWVFGPRPLEGDTIRVDYYSEYEETDEDADESILLQIADDLVIFGALSYACDHFEDKRGPRFEARYTQIHQDLKDQADADELSGNAQVQQAFYYPSDD